MRKPPRLSAKQRHARAKLERHSVALRQEIGKIEATGLLGRSNQAALRDIKLKDCVAAAIDSFLADPRSEDSHTIGLALAEAFGVSRGRGAPSRRDDQMKIARAVYPLWRKGLPLSQALSQLSEEGVEFDCDESTVRRAIKECVPELVAEEISTSLSSGNN